jgi:hypothetical protein
MKDKVKAGLDQRRTDQGNQVEGGKDEDKKRSR